MEVKEPGNAQGGAAQNVRQLGGDEINTQTHTHSCASAVCDPFHQQALACAKPPPIPPQNPTRLDDCGAGGHDGVQAQPLEASRGGDTSCAATLLARVQALAAAVTCQQGVALQQQEGSTNKRQVMQCL